MTGPREYDLRISVKKTERTAVVFSLIGIPMGYLEVIKAHDIFS